ncbi:hypothetical protein PVAND_006074 [Polypedilum vanderplanki]|uniref:Major facilitator superfamily (MFS) profile domain-containing protein n=1 Tax=Polypedilum vanderplanki TaxID=319348 RepID=A0A9J6C205_POLVA|nr:hypothetical protein PVAND_006074 [Polypedilum vanderplanki]
MGGCMEFIDFSQKNKPQGNALSGGIFILLVSGMQISWIFDIGIKKLSWAEGHSSMLIMISYMSFYIAGGIGLFAASATINRLTKKNIYFTSLIFVTTASGLLIFVGNNYYVVTISRSMIGFAHGYAYLTSIVHASEIMHQKLRGMIIAAFQICIMSSALLTSSLANTIVEETFESFQWLGVIGIIYSALGILFTFIFTRESPVSLMRQKKFDQAISIMIKVRNESDETWSIRNEYNELKTMVEEDEQTSSDILADGNVRPLILITLLKIAFVISFNYGLNTIRLYHTSFFITAEGHNLSALTFLTVRMLTMVVTIFSIEINGRRLHFIVSQFATAILICIFAVVVLSEPDNFKFGYEVINLLLEVAAGIGMGIIADVYSSEAFNTLKKPRSIFVSTTIEFVLHIVIIFTTFDISPGQRVYEGIFMMASGVSLMIITILLYRQLPETSKMSIRQTRSEFMRSGEIVFSGSNKMAPSSIYE